MFACHSELLQHLNSVTHRLPIRRTPHDNGDERRNWLIVGHGADDVRVLRPLQLSATTSKLIGVTERGESIVLIGFMGSGKSSAGELLEQLTGLPRRDTDELIASSAGMPITAIFDKYGEEEFRRRETQIVAALPNEASIIVTGGGVVLRDENIATLRRLGTIVNLTADEETLFQRVARRETRPLLRSDDPRRTLSELLGARTRLYTAAADFEIDTASLTRDEVAQAILSRLNSSNAYVR